MEGQRNAAFSRILCFSTSLTVRNRTGVLPENSENSAENLWPLNAHDLNPVGQRSRSQELFVCCESDCWTSGTAWNSLILGGIHDVFMFKFRTLVAPHSGNEQTLWQYQHFVNLAHLGYLWPLANPTLWRRLLWYWYSYEASCARPR